MLFYIINHIFKHIHCQCHKLKPKLSSRLYVYFYEKLHYKITIPGPLPGLLGRILGGMADARSGLVDRLSGGLAGLFIQQVVIGAVAVAVIVVLKSLLPRSFRRPGHEIRPSEALYAPFMAHPSLGSPFQRKPRYGPLRAFSGLFALVTKPFGT